MSTFVIAYVPNVENVDNIENIELLKKVNQVDNLTNVERVAQVENVSNVETVQNVNTVHDVRKLPHPYFPLKKYNMQHGGRLHITPTNNIYQAVYVPDVDCEFKAVNLCFTAYNVEDTYDVLVGGRYVIRNSPVKEMAEIRTLEVYEVVSAGTPIIIQFHNNSGCEKYLMWDVITLIDSEVLSGTEMLNWTFDWQQPTVVLREQENCNLVITQPNYVNLESNVDTFSLEIVDLTTQSKVCTISYADGVVSTDYKEYDPWYQGMGFLARVNVVAITSITRFDKSIQIVFRNINDTGTADPHPIEIGVRGSVKNKKV